MKTTNKTQGHAIVLEINNMCSLRIIYTVLIKFPIIKTTSRNHEIEEHFFESN